MALPDLAYRLIGRFSVTRFDRVLHPLLYRLAGGRGPLGHALGADMVLLTTVGRHSGKHRTVALFGFRSGGAWVVIGSRGGSGSLPGWYHNLVAEPHVEVRFGRSSGPARAVELAGDEYEAAFELAAAGYPGYRLYRREARHRIPIVRLDPVVRGGGAYVGAGR